jgi:hypothetical protein
VDVTIDSQLTKTNYRLSIIPFSGNAIGISESKDDGETTKGTIEDTEDYSIKTPISSPHLLILLDDTSEHMYI